jgi:hypothetical protein
VAPDAAAAAEEAVAVEAADERRPLLKLSHPLP